MHTYDTIIDEKTVICQPENGYRFTSDAYRLAVFAGQYAQGGKTLEIGAGSGVISAVLAKHYGFTDITALELQDEMFHCLCETVKMSEVSKSVTCLHKNIKEYKTDKRYNTIICNPPYRNADSGRITDCEILRKAKFTETLNISDVFAFARSYLENNGGLYICFPAEHLQMLITECAEYGLSAKKAQFIYPDADKGAKTVLLEYRKNAKSGLKILKPILEES